MVLAKEHPNLNIIVQDQAVVVESGTKVWEAKLPDALTSGCVKFEVQCKDFKILKQLRGSATPDTKLICLEAIMPYACSVTGAAAPEAPEPLPAHWGLVNLIYYYMDMAMLVANNAQERTIGQFEKLFKAAGWKITTVRCPSGNMTTLVAIEAVPI
ncbi:hypothetical protein JOM56_004600 [Amanita muscaria]